MTLVNNIQQKQRLPWHVLPPPVNPGLHVHWYEPIALTQSPLVEQSCLFVVHSSTSIYDLIKQIKVANPSQQVRFYLIQLSNCPSVYSSIVPFVCPFVYLFFFLSIYSRDPSSSCFFCLPVHLFLLFICLSIHLSVSPWSLSFSSSVHLSICPSSILPIC